MCSVPVMGISWLVRWRPSVEIIPLFKVDVKFAGSFCLSPSILSSENGTDLRDACARHTNILPEVCSLIRARRNESRHVLLASALGRTSGQMRRTAILLSERPNYVTVELSVKPNLPNDSPLSRSISDWVSACIPTALPAAKSKGTINQLGSCPKRIWLQ